MRHRAHLGAPHHGFTNAAYARTAHKTWPVTNFFLLELYRRPVVPDKASPWRHWALRKVATTGRERARETVHTTPAHWTSPRAVWTQPTARRTQARLDKGEYGGERSTDYLRSTRSRARAWNVSLGCGGDHWRPLATDSLGGGQVRSVRTRLRGGLVVYICYVM